MNIAHKQPVKADDKSHKAVESRHPMEALRRQIDRLFDDFDIAPRHLSRAFFDVEPFWHRGFGAGNLLAVDVVEKDKQFEITAELPGVDGKNVDVKLADGLLTIKGEKSEAKEETSKDSYLSERHYGLFERTFRIPTNVDTDKIEASFDKGVLTVSLPKKQQAEAAEKKITVKAG